ncbi:Bug family tripartite tricarboxylate transporter substrate binding protein [Microbacterium sp. ASV49]|uniref:Tripartite tricarboxylate transporter substrate binding protein n=1 Tax=Microbacterium candidum TaxID=3041922 RepID=A0ABT7MXD7_9MICO|nr:tripartite tricarboxylate transporter substrate binding protein [Microbacterium sp. ASV49]MDL9979095.1 tripartite tricarboxylate transporter substrate binding protein [Microbacterium sp. ASV49]
MRKLAITAAVVAAAALALTGCSGQQTPASTGGAAADTVKDVQIIVPADPGGGWDQTGRAISKVVVDEKLVGSAPVTNIGGAGGTVGLAKLANEKDPHTLMVTGLVMVGAQELNASASRIADTTPIARLTEEPLVVVVPKDSPYKTLKDLMQGVEKDGQKVTITGGSAGGADHILAGLLLGKAGLEQADIAEKLNYVPNSGGGEAVTMLLGGNAKAGISGVGEFAEFVKDGSLRALAVSSDEASPLLPDVPTITDAGYDVVLTNWRGVLAPGGITAAQKAALTKLATDFAASDAWKAVLKEKAWTDAFLAGDEFGAFVKENVTDVTKTLKNIGLVQ